MKFKDLLEVSKFDEYNLGIGILTKEEIEEKHKYFFRYGSERSKACS